MNVPQINISFECSQCGHERPATEAERRKAAELMEDFMKRTRLLERIESLEDHDAR